MGSKNLKTLTNKKDLFDSCVIDICRKIQVLEMHIKLIINYITVLQYRSLISGTGPSRSAAEPITIETKVILNRDRVWGNVVLKGLKPGGVMIYAKWTIGVKCE